MSTTRPVFAALAVSLPLLAAAPGLAQDKLLVEEVKTGQLYRLQELYKPYKGFLIQEENVQRLGGNFITCAGLVLTVKLDRLSKDDGDCTSGSQGSFFAIKSYRDLTGSKVMVPNFGEVGEVTAVTSSGEGQPDMVTVTVKGLGANKDQIMIPLDDFRITAQPDGKAEVLIKDTYDFRDRFKSITGIPFS